MRSKKAQLGLGLVQNVFIKFLIISVISVAIFLALTSLGDVTDDIITTTVTDTNITTATTVNTTGAFLTGTELLRNCALSTTAVTNASGTAIPAINFTVSGCSIAATAGTGPSFNNTIWNVSGSYTFSSPGLNEITGNITGATVSFFTNTSTIYAILVVVVILLAIFIVVRIVQGAGQNAGGRSKSGDVESGSISGI